MRKPKESALGFECEITSYSYSPGQAPLLTGITERVTTVHRKHLDWNDAITLLLGSAEGLALAVQVPKFVGTVEKLKLEDRLERFEFYAAGVVALGSGVVLGVKLGYEDSPDCSSSAFSDNLAKKSFWETIYKYYMDSHSVYFVYDDLGIPQIDTSKGMFAIITSHRRSDLIMAIDNKAVFSTILSEIDLDDYWLFRALKSVHQGYIPWFWIREDQLAKSDPQTAWLWEQQITSWAPQRGPIAARILVDQRFKGDVMVVLRRWIIDKHGHERTIDFVSSRSTRDPFQLERELKSLDWDKSTSASAVLLEKRKLLNANF